MLCIGYGIEYLVYGIQYMVYRPTISTDDLRMVWCSTYGIIRFLLGLEVTGPRI